MALTLGTNCGFVTVAPTTDPAGSTSGTAIDGSSVVMKHTTPANAVRITEIGWYRSAGTNTANFEVALYADTAGVAAARLFVDATNSSASGGWITTAVDWAVSPSTAYWLGLQMDAHTGSSNYDEAGTGGAGVDIRTSQTTLNDPYGGGAVLDADGMVSIYALVQLSPDYTQAEAAFYEDGTEAGATAIDSGADSITRDVSGGDSNLQLRVRLQNTNASPGLSTDDYQLQYELNDSGTFYDVGTTVATYYFDASDAGPTDSSAVWTDDANAFDGSTATSASTSTNGTPSTNNLVGEGTNAPSGNTETIVSVRARSYGSSVGGTGPGLGARIYTDGKAQSLGNAFVSGASGWGSWFSLITPTGGWDWTKLAALEVYYESGADSGTPTSTVARTEIEVTYQGGPVLGYNSASLTDGNATTNRLGSGSGSFVAGEISEDGLVDNLTITASNYTELLYSLTIESTAVADADTLDFRVLRNGATTGMTYTVTPRITIDAGGSPPATANSLTLLGVG